ncbi:hypothetical protein RB195_020657 [Necator americanus]|uniref:Uncharacterized protein n=1 Tax=Necator americanus TaxID=51031 RepID=A0ABR1CJV2_NECAM
MGQLGKGILKKLDKGNRRQFLRCLNAIADKRDVVSAARCLIEAKENYETKKATKPSYMEPWMRAFTVAETLPSTRIQSSFLQDSPTFSILTTQPRKKYRKNHKKRIDFLEKLKLLPAKISKEKYQRKSYKVVTMDHAPSLLSQAEKSVVRRVTRLVKAAIQEDTNATASNGTSKWVDSYKSLLTIKKALDERAKQPGAKVYDFRMFDLVIGNSKPTRSKGEKSIIPPIVQDAYNLIHTLEGKSKEVGDSSNIKFLSPRFAPIMPDKADIRGSLSPSILSFYKDDTEEQLLPIPKLLDATGMNESDREDVLETVMEMTGARQIIDDAMKTLSSTELFGMQGELQEVTNRLTKIFTNLEKTFNRKQKKDMKKRGFTFLETNQLEELHGEQGLAKHANDMDFNIQEYGNQTRAEREDSLWLRIAEIAANGTKTRTKRQITWLSVLKPTVLSPYMFSPVFGLTVLGPCVLSPSLFSPLLLNPAVLSPYVLSPAVGMPFILSPYLLSPYVLSPLVMAPFILNPYVLSPNVINPYVLSPLILSPLVLCPDVVSPMVLGGAILSPGVLSPSVLSKSFLMASVLSPTVLS